MHINFIFVSITLKEICVVFTFQILSMHDCISERSRGINLSIILFNHILFIFIIDAYILFVKPTVAHCFKWMVQFIASNLICKPILLDLQMCQMNGHLHVSFLRPCVKFVQLETSFSLAFVGQQSFYDTAYVALMFH